MTETTSPSPTTARIAPGPSPLGCLNYGVGFIRNPFGVLHGATEKYGPIVRFGKGSKCTHLIYHPDHVKRVLIDNNKNYEKSSPFGMVKTIFGRGLLFNEGQSWFAQRRLMQPSFQPKQFSKLSDGISDVISDTVGSWPGIEAEKTDIEVDMVKLSYQIIGKLLFGTGLSGDMQAVLDSQGTKTNFYLGQIAHTPQNRKFKDVLFRVNKLVYAIIAERRAAEHPGDDMLGILMSVKDKDTGQGMNDLELRDEIVTLLFSGFDTTSRTLSWAFHALAQNPEVEKALYEEIDRVLQGRTPRYDDLPNLPYTQMLIKETMRVYPPNPLIGRRAKEDDVIGGVHIPAGSFLTISAYLAQQSEELWDNPKRFDPLRFAPEKESEIPRFAYFPFGGGPRQCIGQGIAMMTIPLAIATVAQRYRFVSAPGHVVEPDIKLTYQSRRGIHATRHLRTATIA
jgi:cytochrome P450